MTLGVAAVWSRCGPIPQRHPGNPLPDSTGSSRSRNSDRSQPCGNLRSSMTAEAVEAAECRNRVVPVWSRTSRVWRVGHVVGEPVTIDVNWQLILDFLHALAWPVIVASVLIAFRRQIGRWLNRLPERIETPFGAVAWAQSGTPVSEVDEALDEDFDALAREVERGVVDSEREAAQRSDLEERLARSTLELEFERLFNRIFGSQIRLLEGLENGRWTRAQVEEWVQAVKNANPIALNGWTVDQYLLFLRSNGLLNEDEHRLWYEISEKGRTFLAYMRAMGYGMIMRQL